MLPIDDTHFRIYVGRPREASRATSPRCARGCNGKLWEELTEEEHRNVPGDYEAQVSQGPIAHHSEEHLATSDEGVVMLRRLLQRQIEAVQPATIPST